MVTLLFVCLPVNKIIVTVLKSCGPMFMKLGRRGPGD